MNTEQQLAVRGECIVVNTVLDNPVAKLPPNICTALAYTDFWESVEARQIALGLKKALNKGRPTHRMVVRTYMESQYRQMVVAPDVLRGVLLQKQGLPHGNDRGRSASLSKTLRQQATHQLDCGGVW